jgi:hypothetical protein
MLFDLFLKGYLGEEDYFGIFKVRFRDSFVNTFVIIDFIYNGQFWVYFFLEILSFTLLI